jgi:prepilin peptidase CpaA
MTSVLLTLLAIASVWDIALHRVPNALAVGIAAVGLVDALLRGGVMGLGGSVLAVVCVGALVWPAWARRMVGGGDLKLAAAGAAWLGIRLVPAYLLTSAVAIGTLAIVSYALSASSARADVRRNLSFAVRGVPFAVAIGSEAGRAQVPAGAGFAVAAIVTLVLSGGLR